MINFVLDNGGVFLVLLLAAYGAYWVYENRRVSEAVTPYTGRRDQPDDAQDDVERVLRQCKFTLADDAWEVHDDGARSGYFMADGGAIKRALTADFGIRAITHPDGEVKVVLANDGKFTRSYVLGFIPFGPKQPIGGDAFSHVKRRLREALG